MINRSCITILVIGETGSGKTTLINTIANKIQPFSYHITNSFNKYTCACTSENIILNIYDSKGLEHGKYKHFMNNIRKFLTKCLKNNISIDVIWFVINSATSRWEFSLENICKTFFNNKPIIFVLNKSDISTIYQRKKLEVYIKYANLHNLFGIYHIISKKNVNNNIIQNINYCKKCNSDDLVIMIKSKSAICLSCKHKESFMCDNNIEQLIKKTIQIKVNKKT